MVNTLPMVAAIRFQDQEPIDTILEAVARRLQSSGLRVAGFLQREVPDGPGCCPATFLEDISTGELLRITQALGPGSRGCRLDPPALAGVSGQVLPTIAAADFLILNRFGKGESTGQGFRAVIEKACELGVPVLTAVRPAYEPFWSDFAAEIGVTLTPDLAAVLAWAQAAIASQRVAAWPLASLRKMKVANPPLGRC
jgi:nucleoside-triphosphatase THEP1